MTDLERFDPFERRTIAAIAEIAAARQPDYLADILRQTARSSQRPRRTFLERLRRMNGLAYVAATAAVIAVLAAGTLLLRPSSNIGPGVSPTPSAGPASTVGPTASGPASLSPSPTAFAALPTGNGPIVVTLADPNGGNAATFKAIGLDGQSRFLDISSGYTGSCPTFSPDGTSLAYIGFTAGNVPEQQLIIANADGSAPRVMWHGSLSSQVFHVLFWSHNSERVAVTSARDPLGALVVANRTDGTTTVLDWGSHEFPGETAFSPDGTQLASIMGEANSTTGIEVGPVDGTGRRVIASAPFIRSIAWSPDGTTIAYVAAKKGDRLGGGDGDLFFVDLAGGAPRLIDTGAESYYLATWSPDGQLLAVSNDTGPVVVFDRLGVEQHRVSPWGDYVRWSPDSRSLLVVRNVMTVVDIASGGATELSVPPTAIFQCGPSWQAIPVNG